MALQTASSADVASEERVFCCESQTANYTPQTTHSDPPHITTIMFKLSTLAVASLSLGANAFAPRTSGIARAPTALRVAEIPVIDEEEEIPVIDEAVPVSSRHGASALLVLLAMQLCLSLPRFSAYFT